MGLTDEIVLQVEASKAFITYSDDRGHYSGMIPNYSFNLAMSVLFGLIFVFHITMLIPYKQWWFGTCFIIATAMETIGYIARVISHNNIYDNNPFLAQYICLTIAPVFTMAGIYYQLAKLSMVYGPENSRLKPMLYSKIFIALDALAILVQAGGGGIASAANDETTNLLGTHIFVAGLSLQVASMTLFLGFWFDFLYSIYVKIKKGNPGIDLDFLYNPQYSRIRSRRGVRYFPLAITCAVFLIYVRCCYRVGELAEGWHGYLIRHEIYFVILDAVMMLVANTIFIPFYPGFMFDGRHTNIGVQGFKKSFRKISRTNNRARTMRETEDTHGTEIDGNYRERKPRIFV